MKVPAAIKELVKAKLIARSLLRTKRNLRQLVEMHEQKASVAALMGDAECRQRHEAAAADARERLLQAEFAILEIGHGLRELCKEIDALGCRELVFEALNTNKADRSTPLVAEYGTNTLALIGVLDLENSATKCAEFGLIATETRPLKWACTTAMFNAMKTNEKFARAAHQCANDVFDGAFGEYRERPLSHRLAGV